MKTTQNVRPLSSTGNLRKKEREATQIASLKVTQMIVHANKQSKDISNIQPNFGFDKCGSFEEVAHLVLMRSLSINASGVARVNITVNNKKQISCFFYSGSCSRAVHYPLHSSLEELDHAFLLFEEMEVCHA